MKKTLLPALLVGMLAGTASVRPARAEETSGTGRKPVFTASLAGFDTIRRDLQWIVDASGNPFLSLMLLGAERPAGLDAARPWGAVVETDGEKLSMYAFVPVTDLKQLLEFVSQTGGPAVPSPDENGVYQIGAPGWEVYLQQKGGWALATDRRETLASTPEDPIRSLAGLDQSHTAAFRVAFKDFPPSMRQQLRKEAERQLARSRDRMPGETDLQYAVRRLLTPRSAEEYVKFLEETDAIQVGLAVDPQSKAVRLDGSITAVEGTQTAAGYPLLSEPKSNLAGFFLPEAALAVHAAGTLSEPYAARLTETIDAYASDATKDLDEQDLSDADRNLAKQVFGDLIDVLRKTAESRRVDLALAVVADAESLSLVAAGCVADAAKLEKLFKQVVDLEIQADPEAAKAINLDAEQYQGVRLHTVSVPADVLCAEELPAPFVGDSLTAVVGFSDENVYLAAGPQAMERLKQAIDLSKAAPGQPVPPFRLSMSATALGHMIEATGAARESDVPPEIIAALKQAGPDDHVTLVADATAHGMRIGLDVEQGVLKVIGVAAGAAVTRLRSGGGPARPEP